MSAIATVQNNKNNMWWRKEKFGLIVSKYCITGIKKINQLEKDKILFLKSFPNPLCIYYLFKVHSSSQSDYHDIQFNQFYSTVNTISVENI